MVTMQFNSAGIPILNGSHGMDWKMLCDADDLATSMIVDPYLGFETHKMHRTSKLKSHLALHVLPLRANLKHIICEFRKSRDYLCTISRLTSCVTQYITNNNNNTKGDNLNNVSLTTVKGANTAGSNNDDDEPTEDENNIAELCRDARFSIHLARFLILFDPASGMELRACHRYAAEGHSGAAIFATRRLPVRTRLHALIGCIAELKRATDERSLLRPGQNDYSVMYSSRKRCSQLWLGPAAYMNHDCTPNCKFITETEDARLTVQCIREIDKDCELFLYYGNHFFNTNNKDCECATCEAALPPQLSLSFPLSLRHLNASVSSSSNSAFTAHTRSVTLCNATKLIGSNLAEASAIYERTREEMTQQQQQERQQQSETMITRRKMIRRRNSAAKLIAMTTTNTTMTTSVTKTNPHKCKYNLRPPHSREAEISSFSFFVASPSYSMTSSNVFVRSRRKRFQQVQLQEEKDFSTETSSRIPMENTEEPEIIQPKHASRRRTRRRGRTGETEFENPAAVEEKECCATAKRYNLRSIVVVGEQEVVAAEETGEREMKEEPKLKKTSEDQKEEAEEEKRTHEFLKMKICLRRTPLPMSSSSLSTDSSASSFASVSESSSCSSSASNCATTNDATATSNATSPTTPTLTATPSSSSSSQRICIRLSRTSQTCYRCTKLFS